jgi:hypothetical protein
LEIGGYSRESQFNKADHYREMQEKCMYEHKVLVLVLPRHHDNEEEDHLGAGWTVKTRNQKFLEMGTSHNNTNKNFLDTPNEDRMLEL